MQGQIERENYQGVDYCSRNVIDIIKKNAKVRYHSLPEEFVGDSVNYRIDSSYVYIKKRKYLQTNCFSDKLNFKTLTSVGRIQKNIYTKSC